MAWTATEFRHPADLRRAARDSAAPRLTATRDSLLEWSEDAASGAWSPLALTQQDDRVSISGGTPPYRLWVDGGALLASDLPAGAVDIGPAQYRKALVVQDRTGVEARIATVWPLMTWADTGTTRSPLLTTATLPDTGSFLPLVSGGARCYVELAVTGTLGDGGGVPCIGWTDCNVFHPGPGGYGGRVQGAWAWTVLGPPRLLSAGTEFTPASDPPWAPPAVAAFATRVGLAMEVDHNGFTTRLLFVAADGSIHPVYDPLADPPVTYGNAPFDVEIAGSSHRIQFGWSAEGPGGPGPGGGAIQCRLYPRAGDWLLTPPAGFGELSYA